MNTDAGDGYRGFAPGALLTAALGIGQGVASSTYLVDASYWPLVGAGRVLALATLLVGGGLVACSLWSLLVFRVMRCIPVVGVAHGILLYWSASVPFAN